MGKYNPRVFPVHYKCTTNIETTFRDLGQARRREARNVRRRAQLRENLRRTIHTAIWLFATVALAAWMLSW